MRKIVNFVKDQRADEQAAEKKAVVNFMGGISYEWNALDTLKMITASSIFGEPAYYRDGEFSEAKIKESVFRIHPLFREYVIDSICEFVNMKTSDIMEKAIDNALDCDFKGTLEWAAELRHEFYMRLNPQVIMVRAAMHPKRAEFTRKYPGLFSEINEKVMARADEPASQLTYYLYKNGSKKNMPNILKKSWAKKLESLSYYEMYKYRNTGIGMIDTIRICHANSEKINELMRTGTIAVDDSEVTWEKLRAEGKSWREILDVIRIGHMALLRNLRGIFSEIDDYEYAIKLMEQMKRGVENGKQFPFRYSSAYQAIKEAGTSVHHAQLILDTLNECIDIACDNLPKLKGRTMCLSDNSGSAWGSFTSEFGKVRIANIDNLSSVIAARNSDEGFVGKFGDELKRFSISKLNGVLTQAENIDSGRGDDVGGGTENGIWLFFRDAIDKKEWFDNIFVYSDMQAGHGGLYGTADSIKEYRSRGFAVTGNGSYVDVAKLIAEYRRKVNPKVNVFCVQTAGYDNVIVPENGYRTALLYGWTGKELVYADAMNRFWDEKDRS